MRSAPSRRCATSCLAAVLVRPDWGAVAAGSLVPHIQWDSGYLSDVMSLVGTTLTGYVYFWQTVGQAEDQVPWRLHRARQADSLLGSLFAVAVFWFILIASGATLGAHHLSAGTEQGAARALRPVAGPFAGDLFAVGLLASALSRCRSSWPPPPTPPAPTWTGGAACR